MRQKDVFFQPSTNYIDMFLAQNRGKYRYQMLNYSCFQKEFYLSNHCYHNHQYGDQSLVICGRPKHRVYASSTVLLENPRIEMHGQRNTKRPLFMFPFENKYLKSVSKLLSTRLKTSYTMVPVLKKISHFFFTISKKFLF